MNNQAKSNVEKYPPHMQGDYVKRNQNIDDGRVLCERCNGTGNEVYSMYQKCVNCRGMGYQK